MRWNDIIYAITYPDKIASMQVKIWDVIIFYFLGFVLLLIASMLFGLINGDVATGALLTAIVGIPLFIVLALGEGITYVLAKAMGGKAGLIKHLYVGSLLTLPLLAALGLVLVVAGALNIESDFSFGLDIIFFILLTRATFEVHELKEWWKGLIIGIVFFGSYIAVAVVFAILAFIVMDAVGV